MPPLSDATWQNLWETVSTLSGTALPQPVVTGWTPPDRPLAALIDHTLLAPTATPADISRLTAEARAWQTAAVCVNPAYVAQVARELAGSSVLVATVAGFPLGSGTPAATAYEAHEAVQRGAAEVDMVIALGALKAGRWHEVLHHLRVVRDAVPPPLRLKVILETGLLTDEEKALGALLAAAAGADFVKTSTGFLGGGATEADVALLRRAVGPHLGVKASAGIRARADALALVAAGADRLGTSRTAAILGVSPMEVAR